ncbi:hypothetical protein RB614_27270 [Phytohabitans sp. ZYX-F-186]|uniref:GGDEF domain-containing protein n=1 Tax=Phytohabitans maris TaxID=3071409 RepID=A0ABU0ZMG5_9ACTN|nr:hypothetical protein [Phytohabitans sp. ZYX-F-186]MDQ7908232.1 hypothetical protein [Phytohabitans sp. ZYX-F-186]
MAQLQWRSDWLSATIRTGWTDIAAWHLPAVDTIIRATGAGDPSAHDVLALAEQRAELGCGLDETLRDVEAFLSVLRSRGRPVEDPFTIARLAALGWQRAAVHRPGQPCQDPLTGLATDAHLVRRADEIYRWSAASGVRPHEALVVLDWPRAACTPNHLAARLAVAEAASTFFDAGETAARVGGYAIVALCPSAPPRDRLDRLAARVDAALGGCVRARVTAAPFPPTLADLADLVAERSHAGPPVPCRGDHVTGSGGTPPG